MFSFGFVLGFGCRVSAEEVGEFLPDSHWVDWFWYFLVLRLNFFWEKFLKFWSFFLGLYLILCLILKFFLRKIFEGYRGSIMCFQVQGIAQLSVYRYSWVGAWMSLGKLGWPWLSPFLLVQHHKMVCSQMMFGPLLFQVCSYWGWVEGCSMVDFL